ncbi:hypothetical protein [Brevibacterium samyangense]|uniref:Uncharacterized protein n=1 Tax=Brevibacterium samyangense TaxID=366888 RepID=A0ABN2T8K7_9MICO
MNALSTHVAFVSATSNVGVPSDGATEGVTPPDPELVTPGTLGFLVTFFIVVVVVFLIRDAFKRVRRIRAADHAEDRSPIPVARPNRPAGSTGAAEAPRTPGAGGTSGEGASGPEDDGR